MISTTVVKRGEATLAGSMPDLLTSIGTRLPKILAKKRVKNMDELTIRVKLRG